MKVGINNLYICSYQNIVSYCNRRPLTNYLKVIVTIYFVSKHNPCLPASYFEVNISIIKKWRWRISELNFFAKTYCPQPSVFYRLKNRWRSGNLCFRLTQITKYFYSPTLIIFSY